MELKEALRQARKDYQSIILSGDYSVSVLLKNEVHAGLCRHFRDRYEHLNSDLFKLLTKVLGSFTFYYYTPSDFWNNDEKIKVCLQKRIELIDKLLEDGKAS